MQSMPRRVIILEILEIEHIKRRFVRRIERSILMYRETETESLSHKCFPSTK